LLVLIILVSTSSAIHAEEKAIQWQEMFVTVDGVIRPVPGHEENALGIMQET
jgi:hypothetical protein